MSEFELSVRGTLDEYVPLRLERFPAWHEQRLTPEGVELLRSEVVGRLDRSHTPLETLPADDDPWLGPFGGLLLVVPEDGWGLVEVRDGDRLVRLQAVHRS